MAFELLDIIKQAEQSAESVRGLAREEAQAIIKAAQEALTQKEKERTDRMRRQYRQDMEQKEATVLEGIEQKKKELLVEMEAASQKAKERLGDAQKLIIERVLNNGHR